MTPENKQKLKNLLVLHEGYKQFPYVDTTGHLTIGVGRNLNDRGLSPTEAMYLLDDDIIYFSSKLNLYLKFFCDLNEARQIALIDMCFNLGLQGLLAFKEMISALEIHDYNTAEKEMLNSKWAEQGRERAISLGKIIRTGEI